jgi:hypothetical protein
MKFMLEIVKVKCGHLGIHLASFIWNSGEEYTREVTALHDVLEYPWAIYEHRATSRKLSPFMGVQFLNTGGKGRRVYGTVKLQEYVRLNYYTQLRLLV